MKSKKEKKKGFMIPVGRQSNWLKAWKRAEKVKVRSGKGTKKSGKWTISCRVFIMDQKICSEYYRKRFSPKEKTACPIPALLICEPVPIIVLAPLGGSN